MKRVKFLKRAAGPKWNYTIGAVAMFDDVTADKLHAAGAVEVIEVISEKLVAPVIEPPPPPAVEERSETIETAVAEPEVEHAVKVSRRKRGFSL